MFLLIAAEPFLDPSPAFNLSRLPLNLHTLELHLADNLQGKAIDVCEILGCVIPNLRTLILDKIFVSDPLSTNAFWHTHPGIERLEFCRGMVGNWFNNFEVGMLPNLIHLQVSAL